MVDLSGKRILVTGVASGIGRAVAKKVGAYGATVAAFDRDATGGKAAIAALGDRARFRALDITDEAAVTEAVGEAASWMGRFDVLLHIAGVIEGTMAEIDDITDAVWHRVIGVNLTGSFVVARECAKLMRRAGGGVIVLTASGAGVTGGSASIAYAPSKGGVHGLAMSLAMHLAKYNIRVNDVCPGKVDTAMIAAGREQVFRNTGKRPQPASESVDGSPFLFEGNLSPPEGIAEVYAFLSSDQAEFVRGSIFTR